MQSGSVEQVKATASRVLPEVQVLHYPVESQVAHCRLPAVAHDLQVGGLVVVSRNSEPEQPGFVWQTKETSR